MGRQRKGRRIAQVAIDIRNRAENSEIAQQLYLSVRTVETHRSHIQQKLGASSRAELVRYALDNDLIER